MSLYYVRKNWEDKSTQQGAYSVLSNAVAVCDGNTSYKAYDEDGNLVYDPWYYVRPSWADKASQSGAYRTYSNAVSDANKRGYRVYDYLGIPRYPLPYTVKLVAATPYYAAADGKTQAGKASKGVYTVSEVKSPFGRLKSGAGWIDLTGADAYSAPSTSTATKTPLELAANNVAGVYAQAIGCKHVAGSYSWSAAMSGKKVNCAVTASRTLYLAGVLGENKLVSHTTAVKSDILKTKNTIAKAMSGYGNLDLTKCSVKYVGAENFAALSTKYKVKGAGYVYDSNIAIYGGDNAIYSCNNGSNQMSGGVYAKNLMTSGYCFTSPILIVILPND